MLIYKKATKEELEKYRQNQITLSQKDKILKAVPQADLNVLLELFLTFANQRTFTVNVGDIEFQNTLLGLNQDSTLFANVLSKMSTAGALNFIDFAKLYYQSVGSRNSDDEIAELFTTISKDATIDRDHLNRIANELGYTLKQGDLDQIMILMNKGEAFTLDHLNTYLTETISQKINYYTILEVTRASSQKQIKQNYLKLAKIYHPDVYKGNDKERFKLIQEAYQVLKSPDKRTTYDQAQSGEQQFKSESAQENADPKESSDQGFQFREGEYTKAKDSKEVEEDFKKFMEQPIKIDPAKMKIYENSLRRAMGKELREQQDYIFKRNHKRLYQWAYGHMLGYKEHVRLYIQSLNIQFKKKKESKEEINIKTADFYAKWGNMILGTIILLTGPLLYSAMSRRKEIETHMKADEEVATKMIKEFEYMNVLARLVY